MAQKRISQIDARTGEVLNDGFVAYVVPKRKNGFGKGWIALSQETSEMLAKSDLTGRELKVFLMLISRVSFGNMILINQSEIGKELGMQRQHVNKSIKSLISKGALIVGGKVGISPTYTLNPEFGWKGSASDHKTALNNSVVVPLSKKIKDSDW